MKISPRLRLLLTILAMEATLAVTLQSSDVLWRSREQGKAGTPGGGHAQKLVPPAASFTFLKKLTFDSAASLANWEEKVFKNKTLYTVARGARQGFVNSVSRNASSGLYTKLNFEVSPDLILSWRWRVITFPKKDDPSALSNRHQDDFAARIYAVFPGSNLFNSDVIEYIWDESISPGTVHSSPYSQRIKLFVVRSGKPVEGEDGWKTEERNIYEDYEKLFGKTPKRPLGAIAIMSDSDNTASVSEADFGEIVLKTRNDEPARPADQ